MKSDIGVVCQENPKAVNIQQKYQALHKKISACFIVVSDIIIIIIIIILLPLHWCIIFAV